MNVPYTQRRMIFENNSSVPQCRRMILVGNNPNMTCDFQEGGDQSILNDWHGKMTYFIAVEVTQPKNCIFISQEKL